MDNDNKIEKTEDKKNIHKEVMLFLGDELTRIHQEASSQTYDLEKEYEKTKNNKNHFSFIVLACTFVVVLGITVGLTAIISKHDKEVTVSLEEFDDLNLKGLLDTVSKVQTQYDTALKNKMNLENDLDTALRAADNKYEDDLFLIENMQIRSAKDKEQRQNEAKAEQRKAYSKAHEEFDSQIALAQKELEEYKKQLDEYNTTKIESAKEKEKLLDSERELRELQEKELTDKYQKRIDELQESITQLRKENKDNMRKSVSEIADKYIKEIEQLDPVYDDQKAAAYIEAAKENPTADFDASAALAQKEIKNERMVNFYQNYQELYNNFKMFDQTLATLPQKNSVPSYIAASKEAVNQMSVSYVETTSLLHDENVELKGQIKSLNKEIQKTKDDYDAVLDSVLAVQKASGLILTVDEKSGIVIYLAPDVKKIVTDEGAPAEFKAGKITAKGKVFPKKGGNFVFESDVDKTGKPVLADISTVVPGTVVKVTVK